MPAIETLYKEALDMKPTERIALIDRLMQSLDRPDESMDALWKEEAESRLLGFEQGKIGSVPAKEVFAKYDR